jgi:hypothetical protein
MSQRVQLALSHDEALVLLDWLARFNKTREARFEDQAEQRVLWDLEAMLEKALPDVVAPRYSEFVRQARERVRDE